MGKGEIVSNKGDGFYSIKIKRNDSRAETELAILIAKVSNLETTKIPEAENYLDSAETTVTQAHSDLIIAEESGGKEEIKTARDAYSSSLRKKERATAQLARLKFEKISSQQRIDAINRLLPAEQEVDAWCADRTINLSGTVGTIEVPDELQNEAAPIWIRPGWDDNAQHNIPRDGEIKSPIAQTPSESFFNKAVQEGVQTWRPQYRLGEISAINGDTCKVQLDPATSGINSLNINQSPTVTASFSYMHCDRSAFTVGVRVIVEFFERDWDKPHVIGFESDPRPCTINILFNTLSGEILSFNYHIPSAGLINIADSLASDLHAFFNEVVHVENFEAIDLKGGVAETSITEAGAVFANDERFEMEFSSTADSVHARTETATGNILTLTGITGSPEFSGAYEGLISAAGFPPSSWNLWQGQRGVLVNPASGAVINGWQWVPSFYYEEEANQHLVPVGWYYGQYGGVDLYGKLKSAKVTLLAVLETRHKGGTVVKQETGWAEMVTEYDIGDGVVNSADIHIYLNDGNGDSQLGNYDEDYYFYRQNQSAGIVWQTVGTLSKGFKREFTIQATSAGVVPDNFHMWNFENKTDSVPVSGGVGIIVVEGSRARLVRYTTYRSDILDIIDYKGHSVSQDGRIVTIFSGAVYIDKVTTYDLHGLRTSPLIPDDYLQGGYTLISTVDVSDSGYYINVGELVPFRDEAWQDPAQVINPGSASLTMPDQTIVTDYFPALGTVKWELSGNHAPTVSKVACLDGINATFTEATDTCFDSVIYQDDPETTLENDRLVARWAGEIYNGVVRGVFSGEGDSTTFAGITGGGGQAFSRDNDLIVSLDGAEKSVGVAFHLGELDITGCADEDGNFDSECGNPCSGEDRIVVATSSCGQSGEYSEPFTVSLPGLDSTDPFGEVVYVAGGNPPFSFSLTCGSFSVLNETQIEVTNTVGCCDPIFVSVTDACGNSDNYELRGESGMWVGRGKVYGEYIVEGQPTPCGRSVVFIEEETARYKKEIHLWCTDYACNFPPTSCGDDPCCLDCRPEDLYPGAGGIEYAAVRLWYTEEYDWECA